MLKTIKYQSTVEMINPSTTDPQEELLTEVDVNDVVIGPISRKVAHQSPDKIYRTIYVIVKNQNDEVLIHQRSSGKDLYPNCWDLSVGGHVGWNQSYPETAAREIKEELGIAVSENQLKLVGKLLVKLPRSNELFQVFEYRLKPSDKIKIASQEINQTKWLTTEEIKESIRKKQLAWYPRPIQVIQSLY
ncbi:MAG: NUDIX domain-containing protein [Patescibacteria group bacterium]